jgi:hypothetical protein
VEEKASIFNEGQCLQLHKVSFEHRIAEGEFMSEDTGEYTKYREKPV